MIYMNLTNYPCIARLAPHQLKRTTDPNTLPKNSKACLPKPVIDFGQSRAIKAINTALDIRASCQ